MGNDNTNTPELSAESIHAQLSKYAVLSNGSALALVLGALHATPVPKQQVAQTGVALWLFFIGLVFAIVCLSFDATIDINNRTATFIRSRGRTLQSLKNIERELDKINKEIENEKHKLSNEDLSHLKAGDIQARKDIEDIKNIIEDRKDADLPKLEKRITRFNKLSGCCAGLSFYCFAFALIHIIMLECPVPILTLISAYFKFGN